LGRFQVPGCHLDSITEYTCHRGLAFITTGTPKSSPKLRDLKGGISR